MLLSTFVSHRCSERLSLGRFRTARAYRSTLNSVCCFAGPCVSLRRVFTRAFLHDYECYLAHRQLKPGTISFYMRMLRSLYHSAVEARQVCYVPKLFSQVYTGISRTPKRAISAATLRKLSALPLPAGSPLEMTRDLFMFSLYAQGISFVDLAYLRKSDLRGDTLSYRRHKTGSPITVCLLPPARRLIDKYSALHPASPFLFPLIRNPFGNLRLQYENALHTFNRRLHKLCHFGGIREKITSYVSRHSWATIAYHHGVEVSVIRQAMGHRTEEVTRIYLSAFSMERMRRANRLVLNALMGTGEARKRGCHLVSDGSISLQT